MHKVQSSSMAPAYPEGARVLVDRRVAGLLAPFAAPIRTGDVVIVRHEGRLLIKRVAAIGGASDGSQEGCRGLPDADLPAGFLYLVGDNRAISRDSREFGALPPEALRGRVIGSLAPGLAPLRTAPLDSLLAAARVCGA